MVLMVVKNKRRGFKVEIVQALGKCKTNLLLRNKDIERRIQDQREQIHWLQSTAMSSDACLEIDAATEELEDLIDKRKEIDDEQVLEVFEYALEHLMTKIDRRKLVLMQRTTRHILISKFERAFTQWQEYLQRLHDFHIMQLFLYRYQNRNYIGAFRQWEFVCVMERAQEKKGLGKVKSTAKQLKQSVFGKKKTKKHRTVAVEK